MKLTLKDQYDAQLMALRLAGADAELLRLWGRPRPITPHDLEELRRRVASARRGATTPGSA